MSQRKVWFSTEDKRSVARFGVFEIVIREERHGDVNWWLQAVQPGGGRLLLTESQLSGSPEDAKRNALRELRAVLDWTASEMPGS